MYVIIVLSSHLLFTALPAGILCASLALGEAGIEMYDLVSSCSLVSVSECWLRVKVFKGEWNLLPIGVFLKVNLKKSENQSCKRSHKLDGCWSEKNQNVSISSDSIYDSFAYDPVKTRLSEFEVEVEEPTNNKAWNQIFISHKQNRVFCFRLHWIDFH